MKKFFLSHLNFFVFFLLLLASSLYFFSFKQGCVSKFDRYIITKSRMPLVYKVANKIPKQIKKKVLIGLPLTFETLSIIDAIKDKFLQVTVIPQSSGPHSSTQTGVFKYLKKWGIKYYTSANNANRIKALSEYPDIIIDCSFMLGDLALKNKLFTEKTIYIEDTKTGENRLLKLAKNSPSFKRSIILDNSPYKRNYENKFGIGYSVIGSLISMGFYLPFYKVGVVGYGHVGKGVAENARKIGAKQIYVAETNPKAIDEAKKSNFQVLALKELMEKSDIIITATGQPYVITKKDLNQLNKKIILANAGGELEWDRDKIFDFKKCTSIHEDILKCQLNKTEIWELGGGNSINLVRKISVTEFLDITFSQLVYILSELGTNKKIPKGIIPIKFFDSKVFKKLLTKTYIDISI